MRSDRLIVDRAYCLGDPYAALEHLGQLADIGRYRYNSVQVRTCGDPGQGRRMDEIHELVQFISVEGTADTGQRAVVESVDTVDDRARLRSPSTPCFNYPFLGFVVEQLPVLGQRDLAKVLGLSQLCDSENRQDGLHLWGGQELLDIVDVVGR